MSKKDSQVAVTLTLPKSQLHWLAWYARERQKRGKRGSMSSAVEFAVRRLIQEEKKKHAKPAANETISN